MESYFRANRGAVISTTFDKYCYVNVRHLPPFFTYKTELTYSEVERVIDNDEILHPAIRNAMKMLKMRDIKLTYEADLPARSGLGTSSSFAVGMLNAFYALKGHRMDSRRLADDAIYLERVLCNEAGGYQDQIAAAYGGFNRINFGPDGYEVIPLNISRERKNRLDDNLLLFFTGFTRLSSEMQKINNVAAGDKTVMLRRMYELVDTAEEILTDDTRDLDDFGRLLDYTWRLKRQSGPAVSTCKIDTMYERALAAGALGGKLLGAGGGGFLVFYVKPEKQAAFLEQMKDLLHIPFRFEDEGTQILYETKDMYNPFQ